MLLMGENSWRHSCVLIILGVLVLSTFFCTSLPMGGVSVQTGAIYGYTYQVIGWEIQPIPYARVYTEGHSTSSNILGYYTLTNLTFNHEYNVTATKFLHNSDSSLVILNKDQPQQEVNFLLTFGEGIFHSFTTLTAIEKQSFLASLENSAVYSQNAEMFYD